MPPDQTPDQPGQPSPDTNSSDAAATACPCRTSWWRWPLLVLVAALVVFFVTQRSARSGIPWNDDYPAVLQLAQQQQKPVLLAFSAGWCSSCQWMKKNVYPDPQVLQTAQAFIPIMVDTDKEPDLVDRYNVTGIPAYFVLKPDDARIGTTVGRQSPEQFTAFLDRMLQQMN